MTPPDAEKPLSALEVERRCVDDHAGPYATICEDCIAALVAKGRAEGLEAAAKWHEDRADRVERESPGLGNFLSDTDRDYIAKRAAADREDAKSIRALKDAPQGET